MSDVPDRAYVQRRVDEVQAAIGLRGGSGVSAIVEEVRADGFPELADLLAAEIVAAAVTRAAACPSR